MNTKPHFDPDRMPKARPRREHKKPLHPDSSLIDSLGGTMATAALMEVAGASVSNWRYTGIPRARMMFLRVARPDLFNPATSPTQPIVRSDEPHM